uniref:Ribosomal RNA methyltransferase FtsJ domain-containing protein n=1 Tax=Lotharella oceanica TaxID=641309 RepID=A0A7S2TSB9_9EUKA|mmetsp:Transcript_24843/g.46438  ORF Transcript_24843/g.46438 Transcript_24843/m.46438 type:complete len:254 (+) Transcript_24843:2-763(+)
MNGRYYASILPNHHIPAAGDAREIRKGYGAPPSRSYFKLREAFARSRLLMDHSDDFYHQAIAVDLGASPGGWTQFLLEKGCRHVYAVDPGTLKLPKSLQMSGDSELLGKSGNLSRVSHIRGKISRCLGGLKVAMKRDNVATIDILTCDINAHPIQAIQSLLLLHPMLSSKAVIIATLKDFAGGGAEQRPGGGRKRGNGDGDDDGSNKDNVTSAGFETEVRMWLARLRRLAHRIEMFHLLTATTWERTVVMELR